MGKFKQVRSIADILQSRELENVLRGIGQNVLDAASADPNDEYVASLELQTYNSPGKGTRSSPRVVVQVGAKPGLGEAVESKRGTLARALAQSGA